MFYCLHHILYLNTARFKSLCMFSIWSKEKNAERTKVRKKCSKAAKCIHKLMYSNTCTHLPRVCAQHGFSCVVPCLSFPIDFQNIGWTKNTKLEKKNHNTSHIPFDSDFNMRFLVVVLLLFAVWCFLFSFFYFAFQWWL